MDDIRNVFMTHVYNRIVYTVGRGILVVWRELKFLNVIMSKYVANTSNNSFSQVGLCNIANEINSSAYSNQSVIVNSN